MTAENISLKGLSTFIQKDEGGKFVIVIRRSCSRDLAGRRHAGKPGVYGFGFCRWHRIPSCAVRAFACRLLIQGHAVEGRSTALTAAQTGVSTGNEVAVSARIPVNLSLMQVDERLPESNVDIKIKCTDFRMDILDPLLPTFNDLHGTLRCDVSVLGSFQHPQYHGTLSVSDCSFLFVPNNIRYMFGGDVSAGRGAHHGGGCHRQEHPRETSERDARGWSISRETFPCGVSSRPISI